MGSCHLSDKRWFCIDKNSTQPQFLMNNVRKPWLPQSTIGLEICEKIIYAIAVNKMVIKSKRYSGNFLDW